MIGYGLRGVLRDVHGGEQLDAVPHRDAVIELGVVGSDVLEAGVGGGSGRGRLRGQRGRDQECKEGRVFEHRAPQFSMGLIATRRCGRYSEIWNPPTDAWSDTSPARSVRRQLNRDLVESRAAGAQRSAEVCGLNGAIERDRRRRVDRGRSGYDYTGGHGRRRRTEAGAPQNEHVAGLRRDRALNRRSGCDQRVIRIARRDGVCARRTGRTRGRTPASAP